MRAQPVGPVESSVLHDFAQSGPTKEAHRRAIYRSDGILSRATHMVPLIGPRVFPSSGRRGRVRRPSLLWTRGWQGSKGAATAAWRDQKGRGGIVTNHEPDPASMAASTCAFPRILDSSSWSRILPK